MTRRPFAPIALPAAAVLALTACGDSGDGEPDGSATTAAAQSGEGILTLEDGVVRSAETGMTAGFGTLVNTGEAAVTVVEASSDAAAVMELHEVVETDGEMVMQEKASGFVIGAGESYVLEPGGDHVMFLDLTDPIEAGETVTWTAGLDDGSTVTFTVPVRDIAAGDEEYVPSEGGHEHGDMEHGDMEGNMEHDGSTDDASTTGEESDGTDS